jgi:hypothetical protein
MSGVRILASLALVLALIVGCSGQAPADPELERSNAAFEACLNDEPTKYPVGSDERGVAILNCMKEHPVPGNEEYEPYIDPPPPLGACDPVTGVCE